MVENGRAVWHAGIYSTGGVTSSEQVPTEIYDEPLCHSPPHPFNTLSFPSSSHSASPTPLTSILSWKNVKLHSPSRLPLNHIQ